MSRWAIVYNPISGNFRPDRLAAVREVLAAKGVETLPLASEYAGHAVELVRQVEGVERVAVYGGDGTLREAAKGLLGREVPLVFLPGGSGNSTARELGMPKDPIKAARLLLEGEVRTVRPGHIDGEPFMNMAGVGFDALAVHLLGNAVKSRLGSLAYILTGFRCLVHRHPGMWVETPDGRRRAIWAVGARAGYYAGILVIHPKAHLLEPELGLTAVNGWMLIPFGIGRLLLHIPVRGPGLSFEQHTSWRIVADEPVHAHVDGDYLRQDTVFEMGLMEQTIRFCFPK